MSNNQAGNIEEKYSQIIQKIEDNNISVVYVHFVAPDGSLGTKVLLTGLEKHHIDLSFLDGIAVNGRMIPGWSDIPEAEWLMLKPELDSMKINHLDEEYASALMMGSFDRFELDCRLCLKKVIDFAAKMDLFPFCGTSVSFAFQGEKTDSQFTMKVIPNKKITEFSLGLARRLFDSGIYVEFVQPNEGNRCVLDLLPMPLLTLLDHYSIVKWYTESYAAKQDQKIEFSSPRFSKPMSEQPAHFSLWDMERKNNLFFDPEDELELSLLGKQFIAGILKHMREITLLLNHHDTGYQWRYRYSHRRDLSVIHVPVYFIEKKKKDHVGWGKRILFNGFLPTDNLYWGSAVVMLAGLDGINCKDDLHDYENSDEDMFSSRADSIPQNSVFRRVLGSEMIDYMLGKQND